MDDLEKLEQEIKVQNSWTWALQREFIEECLKAQGNFSTVIDGDIGKVHQAFTEKVLGDESIQYYTRVYLESIYEIY